MILYGKIKDLAETSLITIRRETMSRTNYSFTPEYLTKDNEPWFPVMGEFHYSRYPKKLWRDAISKMKAGGIDIVSTYAFWIHHEEVEGEYNFTGRRDLREFTKNVKDCGLTMFLRIGPWCHGEVRNGGFPDWLLQKGFEVRTNNEEYFHEVNKYYKKLLEQVEGYLHKDGGPIIGIQIENEYGHAGGLTGEDGEAHMRRLKQMAEEVGFLVPYYTATGWGGAVTGGMLPVMGGYCEAPWDQRITEIEPSGNYIFTYERNDHNIGSDYGFGTGITYDLTKFPFLTAELGGGLQVTKHRRPIAHAKDIGAMSMVKLGCGVNLLGYYMYHGGTNPKGKCSTLQESKETGYPSDLPKYSYDFAAPIREYGQISETYKEIKLLAMFLHDFGGELGKMPAYIPEDNPRNPSDTAKLRTSVRHNGTSGYIFVNNYQKNQKMAEHAEVRLEVELPQETIQYPSMEVNDKDFFFYPFHMKIGKATLVTALATPLCRLEGDSTTYVFYGEREPQFQIDGDIEKDTLLWITREEAKNAWKVRLDRDYLILTDATVIEQMDGYEIRYDINSEIMSYPQLKECPDGFDLAGMDGYFARYIQSVMHPQGTAKISNLIEKKDQKEYEITIGYPEEPVIEFYLALDFVGESLTYSINGELIGDWFYAGEPFVLELTRFHSPKKISIIVEALDKEALIYFEEWPEMKDSFVCKINNMKTQSIFSTTIRRNR